jgi:hypothetical protein
MGRTTRNSKRILKERLAAARTEPQRRARNEELRRKFAQLRRGA